jgi:Transcriptional accessory protein
LDNTDIHPESYAATRKLLSGINVTIDSIGTPELQQKLSKLDQKQWAEKLDIGESTLADIISGLSKPGRDLRDSMPAPLLRQDVLTMADLKARDGTPGYRS